MGVKDLSIHTHAKAGVSYGFGRLADGWITNLHCVLRRIPVLWRLQIRVADMVPLVSTIRLKK